MKWWILMLIGAVLAFGLSGLVGKIEYDRLQREKTAAVDKQKGDDKTACDASIKLTKETNDALQKDRDDIARRAADYKRLHPSACVILKPSGAADVAAGGPRYAGGDGAVAGSSDAFRDYAAQCNEYRSQRIRLDAFIDGLPATCPQ